MISATVVTFFNDRWLKIIPTYKLSTETIRWLDAILIAYAIAHIVFIFGIFLNHWQFPLFLEVMEGNVFQHFQRAAALQWVYPAPTPEYVPLAYNPLYYYLAIPFSWLFGQSLSTLRLTAFAGYALAGILTYLIVERRTQSRWWGIVAVGLFCAAYRVMDDYLDTAHSDSWLLASILLGAYLIDSGTSRLRSILGVLALIAAFWFKQHGAIFTIFGVLYLTSRDGWHASRLPWIAAILLGPVLYLALGPWLFGSHFHYFTWEVPKSWSQLYFYSFVRFGYHLVAEYGVLFFCAIAAWIVAMQGWRKRLTVWHFMLPAAGLSGIMGSLDAGSADNVYIPVGTIVIVCGVLAIHDFAKKAERLGRPGICLPLLAVSFALMLYDPRSVLVSSRAGEAYADFISVLKGLDGPVYSPSIGQLPADYRFYPAALWVSIDDISRGSQAGEASRQKVRELIAPAMPTSGKAYLLLNMPLGRGGLLRDLDGHYTLKEDFGERFSPLAGVPGRFLSVRTSYPRYLYVYQSSP
jgi:hypothetical protein